MSEIRLTKQQTDALRLFVDVLSNPTFSDINEYTVIKWKLEELGLDPHSLEQVIATIVLTFHYASKVGGGSGIDQKLKRRYAGAIINNPPGSRQLWEEDHGKVHTPKGHFPNGRNHSGRAKARNI